MKRLALAAFLAVLTPAALSAQQPSFLALSSSQPPAPLAPVAPNLNLVPALALPSANSFSFPSAALPDAPAPPQRSYQDDDFYRWELAAGYEYVHFKSAPFSANLSGLHTDVTYYLKDWFGVEGDVVSAWGGDIFAARSKYVSYTGGGRLSWGTSGHRWTPWAHALVGGVHVNPQTAAGGKNAFAVQAGGGVDWALVPRVSLRAEADYVHTRLYSSSQNNFQVGVGFVLHF